MTLKEDGRRAVWKRNYLRVLLGLMGVGAVMAVVGLFTVQSRNLDVVLLPALGDGFLLLMAFCALPGMDRKWVRLVAIMGSGLALLMVVALPAGVAVVWYVDRAGRARGAWEDSVMAGLGTGTVWSSFFCLMAFVAASRFRGVGRVVQLVTGTALLVASVLISAMVWFPRAESTQMAETLLGSIVVAVAGTLLVMVLNRFMSIRVVDVLSDVDQTVFLRCPRCLKEQEVAVGSGACAACKLRIEITIEEPKCPGCRYNLRGLVRPVCPECGMDLRGGGEGAGGGNDFSGNAGAGDLIGQRGSP